MLVHHYESFYSKNKCLKQPLYLSLNSNLTHVLRIKYSWFHTLETYYTTDASSKVSFKNFSFEIIWCYRKYKQIYRLNIINKDGLIHVLKESLRRVVWTIYRAIYLGFFIFFFYYWI